MNFENRIYSIVLLFAALWCAGIVSAPALKIIGENQTANELYSFYSRVCHQQDSHSFHIGSEKFGVCIRCSAIYLGFFLGLMLFPFFRSTRKFNVHSSKPLIFIIILMIIDVLLNNLGIILNATITRILTGILFGATASLYIIPLLIKGCSQVLLRRQNFLTGTGVNNYVRETK